MASGFARSLGWSIQRRFCGDGDPSALGGRCVDEQDRRTDLVGTCYSSCGEGIGSVGSVGTARSVLQE